MNKFFFCGLLIAIGGWGWDGNQILHGNPANKPYQNNPDAIAFVETYLPNALPLSSDAEVLHYASDFAPPEGALIELGVWKGRTINFLAALNPHRIIFGFDSFLGLPENWDKGNHVFPQGQFAWPSDQPLPFYSHNIVLIKGWFADTLPSFIETALQGEKIALIHIDCDIYSSTKTALHILGSHMIDGTILVFDELYNYPNYRAHEWMAFQEFLEEFSFEAEYIAYNPLHEQVAIRLHQIK